MTVTLRLVGAVLILLALMVPDLAAAFGSDASAKAGSAAKLGSAEFDDVDHDVDYDGACGEDEEFEELIDCGALLDDKGLKYEIGEPLAITLLRFRDVRATKRQCEVLLTDIWARQVCSAQGRDCGKLVPGAPPSPGPMVVTSSSSAHSSLANLGLEAAPIRRLGRPVDERMPSLRDLQPPVPPPKLSLQ